MYLERDTESQKPRVAEAGRSSRASPPAQAGAGCQEHGENRFFF